MTKRASSLEGVADCLGLFVERIARQGLPFLLNSDCVAYIVVAYGKRDSCHSERGYGHYRTVNV